MIVPNYGVDDTFHIQFVWQVPEVGYLRALFNAQVVLLDFTADRYQIRLVELVATRQETTQGGALSLEEYDPHYWPLIHQLVGHQILIAFEVADGRPITMRLATLTGEHDYFFRISTD